MLSVGKDPFQLTEATLPLADNMATILVSNTQSKESDTETSGDYVEADSISLWEGSDVKSESSVFKIGSSSIYAIAAAAFLTQTSHTHWKKDKAVSSCFFTMTSLIQTTSVWLFFILTSPGVSFEHLITFLFPFEHLLFCHYPFGNMLFRTLPTKHLAIFQLLLFLGFLPFHPLIGADFNF